MYAPLPVPSNGSDEARKDAAFTDYYEAFLYVKETSKVLDCWKKSWLIPRLHAMYREDVRDLEIAKATIAENAPLAGQDRRILDVEESFTRKDPENSTRQLAIILSDGTRKTVENTFESKADALD